MTPSEIYQNTVDGIFQVTTPKGGTGTAFLARGDGLVITNHHVEEGNVCVHLQGYQGTLIGADVVLADHDGDLAAIQLVVPPGGGTTEPLLIARSDQVHVGDEVIAIGHPEQSAPFSLSRGVISAMSYLPRTGIPFLQANISLNWGNSGGPLLSCDGAVVGVATRINITPDNRRLEGIVFAVPADILLEFINRVPDLSKGISHLLYCPICGYLGARGKYCTHCGSPAASDQQKAVYQGPSSSSGLCPVCEACNPFDTHYCKTCGARL